MKIKIIFGILNPATSIMLSVPRSSLPLQLCCCLFSLFSTLLQRSNSCWLCRRSCHFCCPWISPVLLMSCFEHIVECFKAGEVILGTLVNEKPAAPAPGWHRKVPSYCLVKALSKHGAEILLILPLWLWHPLRVRAQTFITSTLGAVITFRPRMAMHSSCGKLYFTLSYCISGIFCHQDLPT